MADTPTKKDDNAKWTVIGPDGKVMTFKSPTEAAASLRPGAVPVSEIKEAIAAEKEKIATAAAATASAATKATATTGATTAKKEDKKDEPKKEEAKKEEPKKVSAASLLDVTPVAPKLALATEDTDPNIGSLVAKAKAQLGGEKVDVKMPAAGAAGAAGAAAKEEKAPDSIEEIDPSSLIDDNSDDEPSPLSLRDAIIEDAEEDQSHEMVSLKDIVVVPAAVDAEVDSTPPAPAKGALTTLPPTRKGSAPTITVDDAKKASDPPPPKVDAAAKKGPPKPTNPSTAPSPPPPTTTKKDDEKTTAAAAKKGPPKPLPKPEPAAAATTKDDKPKDSKRPAAVASARAAVQEEPKKSGWVIPALAVAVAAVVIWRIMAASPKGDNSQPVTTTTSTATPTTSPSAPPTDSVSTSPTPTTSDSSMTISSPPQPLDTAAPVATAMNPDHKKPHHPTTPGSGEPAPTDSAGKKPGPAAPHDTSGMSMSELLDKAGSAKRSGDYATARELYQKVVAQNPSNVEANGGLGDVFRAQGDLANAKASYERALAASPTYGPAQLGLADTEWDLGNRAAAQRRYAQIVERLGDRAPERAKQRGTANE